MKRATRYERLVSRISTVEVYRRIVEAMATKYESHDVHTAEATKPGEGGSERNLHLPYIEARRLLFQPVLFSSDDALSF